MTQNILNPAAVKLSGRIEYLGFLAGRFENTKIKSLQQNFQVIFRCFFVHLVGIAREGHWLTKLDRLAYVAGH